ncbi:hypothetical protein V493_03721, partial [Pseudogymnoascus sp. VKM F-4281 (FW-2241)]
VVAVLRSSLASFQRWVVTTGFLALFDNGLALALEYHHASQRHPHPAFRHPSCRLGNANWADTAIIPLDEPTTGNDLVIGAGPSLEEDEDEGEIIDISSYVSTNTSVSHLSDYNSKVFSSSLGRMECGHGKAGYSVTFKRWFTDAMENDR